MTNTPHRLNGLFHPKSVAIVGASDRSRWALMAKRNIDGVGFTGKVFMVNRSGGEALGQKAHASCAEIGEPVDAALLLIPASALLAAFDDLDAANIRNAVILSAGFAELGEEGAAFQEVIRKRAEELNINVLGPNTTGFVNFAGAAPIFAGTMRLPPLAGSIGIVAQSGQVSLSAHHFCAQMGIGLSAMIGTGNELNVRMEDAVDYLLDDPATQVVCIFAETTRDPQAFLRVARKARALGKPIVILKVGRSEITAKAAQAHTGAFVGDDKVFDAVCRQYGVVRVRSLDQMFVTAATMSKIPVAKGKRLAIVSISGGISEISADIAGDEGIELVEIAEDTKASLRAFLPPIATVNNPLDLTGTATTDLDLIDKTIATLGAAPEVDALLYIFEVPRDEEDKTVFAVPSLERIGRALAQIDKPGVVFPYTMKPVGDLSRDIIAQTGVPYVSGGLELGLPALAKTLELRTRAPMAAAAVPAIAAAAASGPLPKTEYEAQQFLASHGVPVVPSVLCATAAEAADAARKIGEPIVIKIASEDIAHKSDVGGVRLNVGAADAAKVFDEVVASARKHVPDARIDGVLVSAMRSGGVELLVGIARDPQWGLVLAVGLGGVFVEILQDTSLRLLPVTEADVTEMLGELRGAKMLSGYRNTPPVDIPALAKVITQISAAAVAAGDQLDTLEVNPLLANGSRIEALDALIIAKS